MIEWFDATVLDWFLSIQSPVLTPLMKVVTYLGEGGAIWILLGVILLFRKDTRKAGLGILLALLFSLLVVNVFLKDFVARPRPCWRNPMVDMLIAIPSDYSFPSGHSSSSFAAATVIFLWNRKWGVWALLGAALMAATRLYFYVHYPTDVLAGILLGVIFGLISWKILTYYRDRFKKYY